MRIAWLGLGNMGGPMAANLAAAGHEVAGYDPSEGALSAAAERGVRTGGSLAETVRGADAVFLMLPSGRHVVDALEAPDGVIANLSPGAFVVDSSTIDVDSTRRAHDAVVAAGGRFLDAPVSGGAVGAEAGRLTFMIGGEQADVDDIRPIIDVMAGRVFHIGPAGQGQAAKAVNNMMMGINLAAVCEGAVLAERLGLDARTVFELASASSGDSWALRMCYPVPGVVEGAAVNRDFQPGFSAALMAKDLGLALQAAADQDLALPLAGTVMAEYQELLTNDLGGADCSILVRLVDGSLAAPSAENTTTTRSIA